MRFRDYYEILGVSRSASAEEIRRSYRQLARKYHPDTNKTDSNAEDKFKEINEAYEVLKDPDKRKQYDALGANWKSGQDFRPPPGWDGQAGGRTGFDFGGFSDFFEALFGSGRGGARVNMHSGGHPGAGQGMGGGQYGFDDLFQGGRGPQTARIPNTEAILDVSLSDVLKGGKVSVTLNMPGRGPRSYDISIPKGIAEGKKIRLAGEGDGGGDLLIKVRYARDQRWKIDGSDIIVDASISASQAALGDKVSVEAPDGKLSLTVPAGSKSGRRLRVKGHGLPKADGGQGDLLVQIMIAVPTELTDRQRELFEELKSTGA